MEKETDESTQFSNELCAGDDPTLTTQGSTVLAASLQEATRSKVIKRKTKKPALHENASCPLIIFLHRLFESHKYDACVTGVVIGNVALIIMQTDAEAAGGSVPTWVDFTNLVILTCFAIEVSSKLVVYRHSYFKNHINCVDFILVGLDVFSVVLSSVVDFLPAMSIMRVIRLVRLGKSIRFLMLFPELGLMMTALWGTIKALVWGGLLLLIVLVIYGILAVQLIHPINQDVTELGLYHDCERCPRAFESVWQSMLTFFQQILAGDSWGEVSLPISERSPASWCFFVVVLASLQLMILNVILAAVVDSAQEARKENLDIVAQQKDAERKSYHKRLLSICAELDTDQSGLLTFQEISEGFRDHPDFVNLMEAMDIQPDDISFVWGILDADGSGEVNYTEFAEELFKMKMKDSHTMIVFIKYSIAEMRNMLRDVYELQTSAVSENGSKLRPSCSGSPGSSPRLADGKMASPQDRLKTRQMAVAAEADLFDPWVAGGQHVDIALAAVAAPTYPMDFGTGLQSPTSVSFCSRELKECLRRLEDKFEVTNSLIRTLSAEMPLRARPSTPVVPTPPIIIAQEMQTTPWDICSVRKSRNPDRLGTSGDPIAGSFQPSGKGLGAHGFR